jgi:dihydropteroate synthase
MTIAPRPHFTIPLPERAPLVLGERTLVMGILNVTPDSFADGGEYAAAERAVARAHQMVEEGADIVDVGGESTRPGAAPVDEAEEMRRVLPVIQALAPRLGVPISVDTCKAAVAREALARGAAIVNDVSNLTHDAGLAAVVARRGAALVLMHNRGTSREMYKQAVYEDVVRDVIAELREGLRRAEAGGVRAEQVIVDPGLGFAKKAEHTYAVLARLDALSALGRPILSGPSRKSFLKTPLGEREPSGRDWATAAAVTASVLAGAHIVRVHNVRGMADVVRVADRIRQDG